MGSLIQRITGLSGIGQGVNIWEVAPPRNVSGNAANVIGMVAELPWGEVDEVTTVRTPAEFFAAFYPNVFGAEKDYTTYPALLALLNKPIFTRGGLKVVRVGATGQAKAARTDTGTGTVTITAKHPGAIGNDIARQYTAATGADPLKRNLVITIGSDYSATYEDVGVADVGDIDDPYVDVTTGTLTVMPIAGVAAFLTSGSDGTAVAADYVGTISSTKGIRCFYGESVDVDVLFVAETPTALLAAVNTGLEAFATDTDKGLVVLGTVASQAAADAITYVASYVDERVVYTWPRVRTTNWYDGDAPLVTVDGNAFAAALIAGVDQWVSPGGSGKKQGTTDLLSGINDLEDNSQAKSGYEALIAAGAAPWFIDRTIGAILYKGITTDKAKIKQRRYRDYLEMAIAGYAVSYVESVLDLDLDNQVLGPNTGGFVGAVKQFLSNEVTKTHAKGYSVDPYSENTEEDLDDGTWIVLIKVETYSDADKIVLKAQIGETVTIE